MSSETKDLISNPLPLVAVALLAAGVLVRTLPLESARPHDAAPPAVTAIGEQDVRARLWQDPFEAVPRPARRESPQERAARIAADPLHGPGSLAAQVQRAGDGGKVTILGVMVFGSPYAEDVESRRRMRYAVLSGLAARRYVPDSPGALGYVWTDSGVTDLHATGAGAGRPRMPEVVPYEWFTAEPHRRGLKEIAQQEIPQKEIPRKDKLLVLWLDEDSFGEEALRGLSAVVARVACGDGEAPCRRPEGAAPVRILGPAGSGTLKALLADARKAPPARGAVRAPACFGFRHRAEGEAGGAEAGGRAGLVAREARDPADDRRRRRPRPGARGGARAPPDQSGAAGREGRLPGRGRARIRVGHRLRPLAAARIARPDRRALPQPGARVVVQLPARPRRHAPRRAG